MRWEKAWEELVAEDPELEQSFKAEFPYRAVADAIVHVRAQFRLTQAQLAEKLGTSQAAVARAESGKHPVNVEFLRRIAMALDLDWSIQFSSSKDTESERPEAAASLF